MTNGAGWGGGRALFPRLLGGCVLLWLLVACAAPEATFKIGLVAPFEGRYRPVGYDAIYAARLAVRQANAAGGIAGYPVELVAYDDRGDPVEAAGQAARLVFDPAVLGVVGHFLAETTQAAAPVYARHGLAVVVPANVPAGAFAGALGLGPTPDDLAAELVMAVGRVAGPGRPSAFVMPGDAALAAAFFHRLERQAFPPAAVADQAGVVLSSASASSAGASLAELRQLGWEGLFAGGPEMGLAELAKIAGPGVSGTLFVTGAPWPADVVGADTFAADYAAVSGGAPPGPWAWTTWQAMRALLQAAERAARSNGRHLPTRAGVEKQLPAQQNAPVYVYRYDATGRPALVN